MNTVQDPWHNRKSPAQKAVVATAPMEGLSTSRERKAERQKRTDKYITRALGAGAVVASIAVGVAGMNKAADSIEAETYHPTTAQSEMVKQALPAKAAAEQKKATETTHQNMTVAPRTYHVKTGDTAWNIVTHHLVDANGQPVTGDPRPLVDDIQAKAGANGLDENDVIPLPDGTQYTAVDTQPPK